MIRVLVHDGMLDESDQHHLRVRRAEAGEVVELRDGRGLIGRGRLACRGKVWSVEVETSETTAPPAELTLAVAAGDRDRFGWLVEKSAELGVTRIVPLESARVSGVATRVREEQVERFRRRAVEAIKQSGAAWAPLVDTPMSLDAFVAEAVDGERWLADPDGASPSGRLDGRPVVVVVGPEGGFTAEERERIIAAGFAPTAFGPHILRFETAALAGAVAVAVARQRGAHG